MHQQNILNYQRRLEERRERKINAVIIFVGICAVILYAVTTPGVLG